MRTRSKQKLRRACRASISPAAWGVRRGRGGSRAELRRASVPCIVGLHRSRGGTTPRTPPVVSTTSRQSTQEKRREATPPFRLHRAGVRWRREGKPRRARHAPSFRPHVVGRRGSMARWKGIAISGELKSTAATVAGLQFQVSCIAPILPAPRINGMFLLHSTMASSSCTPPRQHPASKGKQLHACTRRILILGFRI